MQSSYLQYILFSNDIPDLMKSSVSPTSSVSTKITQYMQYGVDTRRCSCRENGHSRIHSARELDKLVQSISNEHQRTWRTRDQCGLCAKWKCAEREYAHSIESVWETRCGSAVSVHSIRSDAAHCCAADYICSPYIHVECVF